MSQEYLRYTNYPIEQQAQYVAQHKHLLTPEQRRIYDLFLSRVNNSQAGFLFVDATGGTGKTFLLNLILAKLRSDGHIALATASSE